MVGSRGRLVKFNASQVEENFLIEQYLFLLWLSPWKIYLAGLADLFKILRPLMNLIILYQLIQSLVAQGNLQVLGIDTSIFTCNSIRHNIKIKTSGVKFTSHGAPEIKLWLNEENRRNAWCSHPHNPWVLLERFFIIAAME